MRDWVKSVLSKCDFKNKDYGIRVLRVIDDISLMVIDGENEDIVLEMNNLRVGTIQLFCLESLKK